MSVVGGGSVLTINGNTIERLVLVVQGVPMGSQKGYVKICGGGGCCLHGKTKYGCKACGGSAWCTHGKSKRIVESVA